MKRKRMQWRHLIEHSASSPSSELGGTRSPSHLFTEIPNVIICCILLKTEHLCPTTISTKLYAPYSLQDFATRAKSTYALAAPVTCEQLRTLSMGLHAASAATLLLLAFCTFTKHAHALPAAYRRLPPLCRLRRPSQHYPPAPTTSTRSAHTLPPASRLPPHVRSPCIPPDSATCAQAAHTLPPASRLPPPTRKLRITSLHPPGSCHHCAVCTHASCIPPASAT